MGPGDARGGVTLGVGGGQSKLDPGVGYEPGPDGRRLIGVCVLVPVIAVQCVDLALHLSIADVAGGVGINHVHDDGNFGDTGASVGQIK